MGSVSDISSVKGDLLKLIQRDMNLAEKEKSWNVVNQNVIAHTKNINIKLPPTLDYVKDVGCYEKHNLNQTFSSE